MSADAKPSDVHKPVKKPGGAGPRLSLENRFVPPAFITLILLVGHFWFGILVDWKYTLLAICVAIACEIVLGKLMVGKVPLLASAYITGISVGILIRSPMWWPFALCAAVSIMSKYVLRWDNRHLWNPSNFGVSAMLFLYPTWVASLSVQWGNEIWAILVVWCLGSVIIMRLRRFHICAAYVISFVAFAYLRHEITDKEFLACVSPITGPMYQLFVFFMITDPRTTVKSWGGQCLVAFLVAFVEMLLRLQDIVHAPYFALFLVGPTALVVEMALQKFKATPPGPVKSEISAKPAALTTVAQTADTNA